MQQSYLKLVLLHLLLVSTSILPRRVYGKENAWIESFFPQTQAYSTCRSRAERYKTNKRRGIFFCGVLHAGHCTDDLASVDFIIYVARSPKWLYDGGAPVARIAENGRLRIAKQGHLRALTDDVIRVTNLPMEHCELYNRIYATCLLARATYTEDCTRRDIINRDEILEKGQFSSSWIRAVRVHSNNLFFKPNRPGKLV